MFRRQPDRTPTLYYEQTETESEEDEDLEEEDDDYYSVEPIEIDENKENKEDHCGNDQDESGAAASSGIPDTTTAKHSEPGDTTSIHSRENENDAKEDEKKSPDSDEEGMESDDSIDLDTHVNTEKRTRTSFFCFKPLMYYNRHLDMYYYFKYFKPYMFDHRLLTMGYDCGCQLRRVHKTSCSWYDSDNIYMIDTQSDLSISEKVAQQKIYKIYMETLNNLPDDCGCGTLASISYMGHSTSCGEFKHIHERESHEVLLATLNKKKKLSFDGGNDFNPTKPNSDFQMDADAGVADTDQVVPIPYVKETTPELNNSSPPLMSMVAKNVTSIPKPPNNPPNPSSFTAFCQ